MNLSDELLAACAAEPIHIPGAIQPHGFLLVLDDSTTRIVQASENLLQRLGAPEPPLDSRQWLGEPLAEALATAVQSSPLDKPQLLGRFALGGELHHASLHRLGSTLVLELEPISADDSSDPTLLHALLRRFLGDVAAATSVAQLAGLAVGEIKRITGFGRVLLYRFDPDGHGHVLAEERDEGYDSYAGHSFPASDIPPQARALYLRNHVRVIPDVDYQPCALMPLLDPRSAQPVDLGLATLRSVSPVHLEYMRNMGTAASMSVSLIVDGALWGLVSCHHATPRHVPYTVRLACEHLGQLASLQIEAQQGSSEAAHGVLLRRLLVQLVGSIVDGDEALAGLADHGPDLLRFAAASGAAVVTDGRCRLVGSTPDTEQVLALCDWLSLQGTPVLASDRLAELHPPAADYADTASGVLALSVSQLHRNYVLWFRPEVVRTIDWAGDPSKPVLADDGGPRLHPRRSFATWRETVRGRSLPWSDSEHAAAAEFRSALLNIVLRRAEEVAELAGELTRINKELEAFSYSVSHDLRAPLRHIAGYADLIRDYDGQAMSERGLRFLANIKDAARFAGTLVDDLLAFSQLGRTALRPIRVDMNALVEGIVRNMRIGGGEHRIQWRIGPLPVLHADPVFMQTTMLNLLTNAAKYSARSDPPRIEVSSEETEDSHVIRVRDNGVGFDMKYVGKLFGVFQRLHGVEEFEGTGIGLASVRRAIERHGGRVEAHGEPDRGATFTIILPRVPVPSPAAPPPLPVHAS